MDLKDIVLREKKYNFERSYTIWFNLYNSLKTRKSYRNRKQIRWSQGLGTVEKGNGCDLREDSTRKIFVVMELFDP